MEPLTDVRYVLVILLPREVEVRLEDAFLSLVGVSKPVVGYHITLIGPFAWRAESKEALDRLRQICATWRPFEIRFGDVGCFRGSNRNALYIRVLSKMLEDLRRELWEALIPFIVVDSPGAGEEYLSHVTLALGLTDEELQRVVASLQTSTVEARFTVTDLHLLEERFQTPWRSIHTFPLGAGAALNGKDSYHRH